jgi:death on curing protein
VQYLDPQEILILHSEIIDHTGGTHGIRDVNLFLSLAERPKTKVSGKEAHPGVWRKASVYLESLAQYHVFADGNKRTAFAAAVRFLYLNNYRFTAGNKEAESFVLAVANKKHNLPTIAGWLKKHSRKV